MASSVRPTLAIAVDVIHTSDYSGSLPQRFGDIKLGKGPVLCKSSVCSEAVNRALEEAAARLDMPVQYEVAAGVMGTDADKMNQTNSGLPVTTLSIPLRYMHSPSEVGCLTDVEQCVELLAEFLCGLDENFQLVQGDLEIQEGKILRVGKDLPRKEEDLEQSYGQSGRELEKGDVTAMLLSAFLVLVPAVLLALLAVVGLAYLVLLH